MEQLEQDYKKIQSEHEQCAPDLAEAAETAESAKKDKQEAEKVFSLPTPYSSHDQD